MKTEYKYDIVTEFKSFRSKRIIAVMLLTLLIPVMCCLGVVGINKTFIKDIAYDTNSKTDNIVYVIENGEYVPFIVLTDKYDEKVLLLREEVMKDTRKISDYSSAYDGSSIDRFLSNEYISELNIKSLIQPTEIPVTNETSLGFIGSATNTINRKVFLLSLNEIGIEDSTTSGREGKALRYFTDDEKNRLAYCDSVPSSWWLRTPNSYYLSCTYVVGSNNKIGNTNTFDLNGIRPAFCVSRGAEIELSGDVIPGKQVYIFK